jgi:NitT/TauT family transport system ATP-binding protein
MHAINPVASDTTSEAPALNAQALSLVYQARSGPISALENLEITIGEGEFFSLIGPSGCGKSSFLKVAAGLLPQTSGILSLEGTEVTGPRRDVGVVLQRPTLLPWKTVLRNVLVPAATLHLDKIQAQESAERLLKLVGLEEFANHYPNELSGGMQQRVGIARSLIHDPSILLMDEPFAALDALTREYMMMELQEIWMHTRKSVLFITHSIGEAVFLSDRVAVMSPRPGRIVHEYNVTLARPRDIGTMGSAAFVEICTELRSKLRIDV